MKYKRIFAVLIFVFVSSFAFSAEKWNVLLSNWKDLSKKEDKSVGLTIKNSIATQLKKNPNFNLTISTNSGVVIADFQDALIEGRTNKADVVVYGDYYIEGERLVVITEIYNVLDNQLKMRKYYTGVVTADIFDTIDLMSADMLVKIKEVLPEMTLESEVKIKKERQTVYETKNLEVKRMFYTRIGGFGDFGKKTMEWQNGGFPATTSNIDQSFPFGIFCLGFAIRYWDFRFDALFSNLPGVPSYDFNNKIFGVNNNIPGYYNVFLSYYLPWFNNSLAVGIGASDVGRIRSIQTNDNKEVKYETDNYSGMPLNVQFIWNPNDSLELSASVLVLPHSENKYNASKKDNPDYIEYNQIDFNVPTISFSAIYFFKNIGLDFKLIYNQGYGSKGDYKTKIATLTYSFTTLGFYTGIVYKVDFLKQ